MRLNLQQAGKLSTRWRQVAETGAGQGSAFTLLELLVVLAIIGFVAAVTLPNIKGLSRSNQMAAATRQLLDDIALARQRAIAGRTTVYMAFMPPVDRAYANRFVNLPSAQRTNILAGQQIAYALFTRRVVGEQPGHENWRYLTRWHYLPEGIFIADHKFFGPPTNGVVPFQLSSNLPIPTVEGVLGTPVPYLAFDEQGRLTSEQGRSITPWDEVIPLARGSILLERTMNGGLAWAQADVAESPPGNSIISSNHIRIDWLTGRARVERPEVQ